jgi:hypothetical protein
MARSHRLVIAVVVGASMASAVIGGAVATKLRSPADAAAALEPPTPSRITVPVEERALSSDVVVRGDVRYEDAVPVKVTTGDAAIVTGPPPTVGDALAEGGVVLEVAERPVLALAGVLPMYRDILPGTRGDDVHQLEAALGRLGYDPGPIDGLYDQTAETALALAYLDRGYPAPEPSADDTARLAAAQAGVRAASSGLESARAAERLAGPLPSDVVAAQAELRQAEAGVGLAAARAAEAETTNAAAVAAARVTRDQAAAALAAVQAALAQRPTDPELRAAVAAATITLAAAESDLSARLAAQTLARIENAAAIAAASDLVSVAGARLAEVLQPRSAAEAATAVADAQAALDTATRELAEVDRAIGVVARRAEIVFAPTLPASITAVNVGLGDPADDVLAEISGASLVVDASVDAADRPLVSVTDQVTIEETGLGVRVAGEVVELADQAGGDGLGDDQYRMVVALREDAGQDIRGLNVKVTIPVASTAGEVLVVPVAALSATGDGDARVEVEDAPDEPTRFVDVVAGLSADGYVEVRPVEGGLRLGDRVVVGEDVRDSDG